jgi:hypothetical protein
MPLNLHKNSPQRHRGLEDSLHQRGALCVSVVKMGRGVGQS